MVGWLEEDFLLRADEGLDNGQHEQWRATRDDMKLRRIKTKSTKTKTKLREAKESYVTRNTRCGETCHLNISENRRNEQCQ